MKLLILGLTGPTGTHVLTRALDHGDDVSVLVRSPEKLGEHSGGIAVTVGDARDTEDLSHAMAGCEAVVSALGRGTSPRNGGLFTDAAEAVVEAAHATGVRRLVWLSSFGVGDTIRAATLSQRLVYRSPTRHLREQGRSGGTAALLRSGLDARLPDHAYQWGSSGLRVCWAGGLCVDAAVRTFA
nr:NAD(P)H-binding protein [Actinomyces procaprae]